MDIGGKILTGGAVTALLAVIGHYATADDFVSGLEESAQTELTAQGIDGVKVAFGRDPLSRTAVLDGEVADDVKQNALAKVLAIPGVSGAHWKGAADVAADSGGGEAVDAETKAKIAECQAGVDKSIEGKKINFRSGSAYLSAESNKIIDEVAAALKPCAGLSVAVSGHTDASGDAGVNKVMSQERADRVSKGLIERGIPENLVTATGYGSEKPLVQGRGAEEDAQNRRIEFKVGAANSSAGEGE